MERFESSKLLSNQLNAITGGDCASLYANETKKDTICSDGSTEYADKPTDKTGDPKCSVGSLSNFLND